MIDVKVIGSSSEGNCYILTSGGNRLLLEAGVRFGTIQEHAGYSLSSMDGCLVTHSHADHCQAVPKLCERGVNVYTTKGTIDALKGKIKHAHRLHQVEPDLTPFYIAGYWKVWCFRTIHDTADSCGFYVSDGDDRLLFLTDTAYCVYRFPGITILLIEANYSEEILRKAVAVGATKHLVAKRIALTHMSLERVIDFLNANDMTGCRSIHLIHLSDGHSHAEDFRAAIQAATGISTKIGVSRAEAPGGCL